MLVVGLLVFEGGLHLVLPYRVRTVGITRDCFARGIEGDQLFRHLTDARLYSALGSKPLTATQAVERRRAFVAADILLHPVELVAGDVQLVRRLIVDPKELTLHAASLHPHQAPVAANAVRDVDDQTALLPPESRHSLP